MQMIRRSFSTLQFVTKALCLVTAVRFVCDASSTASAAEPVRAGVKAHLDLPYVTSDHERQRLDLFVSDAEKPVTLRPVLVWIHGGAWLGGNKDHCPLVNNTFIERGYAVASLNYRLSQHAQFPAQIEDCKAAIRWLRAHAAEYQLDPARIGVVGPSAGGHLVALLGATGETKTFDVGENLEFSSAVQAVIDYYGPTDFVQMDAHATPDANFHHDLPDSPESKLIGATISDPANYAAVQRANPITYLTKAAPPYLIVHGDEDPTVPYHQSELLFAALSKLGTPVHFVTIEGGGHGAMFPWKKLDPIVDEFFDRHLKGDATKAQWKNPMRSKLYAMRAAGAQ